MFAMLSELPEYNDKITIAHAMTPPVILKHNHPLTLKNMETVNTIAVSSKIAFYLNNFCDHDRTPNVIIIVSIFKCYRNG